MRHGSHKIKVQLGIDANRMLLRKLAINFLTHGKITTTEKKARVLKSYLERLVEKTKDTTQANKNFLLKYLALPKLVESLFSQVGPVFKNRIGGYVTMQKLYERETDGALLMRLSWSTPVVIEDKVKVESAKKLLEKKVKK